MNRRTLIATVPALTGMALLSRFPRLAFAQSSYGVFAQANSAYNNSSASIASALTYSLQSVASSKAGGGAVPFAMVTNFSNAYNNWVENLNAVGYFSAFDQAALAYPQAVISTPITAQALAPAVQLASNVGLTTQNAQYFATAGAKYQSGLTQTAVVTLAKSGSRTLFVNLGSALENSYSGEPVLPIPAPVGGGGGMNPYHSLDCNAWLAALIVAGLTGNDIAVAICTYEIWNNC